VVRLSRPVNSKDGPATSARLKAELRQELTRLFAQATKARPAK
jgi:ribonuclease P protein component